MIRPIPATTSICMSRYRSTNMSTTSLKTLGWSSNVVISWNMIPAQQSHPFEHKNPIFLPSNTEICYEKIPQRQDNAKKKPETKKRPCLGKWGTTRMARDMASSLGSSSPANIVAPPPPPDFCNGFSVGWSVDTEKCVRLKEGKGAFCRLRLFHWIS